MFMYINYNPLLSIDINAFDTVGYNICYISMNIF